jgi:hypothetical protein
VIKGSKPGSRSLFFSVDTDAECSRWLEAMSDAARKLDTANVTTPASTVQLAAQTSGLPRTNSGSINGSRDGSPLPRARHNQWVTPLPMAPRHARSVSADFSDGVTNGSGALVFTGRTSPSSPSMLMSTALARAVTPGGAVLSSGQGGVTCRGPLQLRAAAGQWTFVFGVLAEDKLHILPSADATTPLEVCLLPGARIDFPAELGADRVFSVWPFFSLVGFVFT